MVLFQNKSFFQGVDLHDVEGEVYSDSRFDYNINLGNARGSKVALSMNFNELVCDLTFTEQAKLVTITRDSLQQGFTRASNMQGENGWKVLNVTNLIDLTQVVISTASDYHVLLLGGLKSIHWVNNRVDLTYDSQRRLVSIVVIDGL